MSPSSPSTSVSLIRRVGKQDPLAWQRFVSIYAPLVYSWCRRKRISGEDSSDIMQEVFLAVSGSIDGFQRDSGRRPFRAWLHGITSFKIIDHFRRVERGPVAIGEDVIEATMEQVPDEDSYVNDKQQTIRDHQLVLHQTIEAIRDDFPEKSWKAFYRTAVDGQTAPQIAQELGLSPDNVRQIKYRILRRLRTELDGLETDF